MSRQAALARAAAHFDSGEFVRVLATRVACPSESQNPARAGVEPEVTWLKKWWEWSEKSNL